MRCVPVLTLVAALLVAAPSAEAAWTAPQPIASGNAFQKTSVVADSIRMAAGADGTAVATWTDRSSIFASLKPPGGTFGAPVTIGPTYTDSPWQVVVAPTGRALITWETQFDVHVAVREPGGGFVVSPQTFHALPDDQAYAPISDLSAAAGRNGLLYVAFGDSTGSTLEASTPGAGFSQVDHLDSAGVVASPGIVYPPGSVQIAAEGDGSAVEMATSQLTDGTTAGVILSRWSTTGGALAPVTITSDHADSSDPTVAHDSGGDDSLLGVGGDHPAFFWVREVTHYPGGYGDRPSTSGIQRTDVSQTAAPSTPSTIDSWPSPFSYGHIAPVAGVDEAGTGIVAWLPTDRNDGPTTSIRVSQRTSPAGGFGPTVDLSSLTPGIDAYDLSAAPTSGGGGQILYRTGADHFVTELTPNGTASTPVPLKAGDMTTGSAAIAGSGRGDTASVFYAEKSFDSAIEATYDDVTPPTLNPGMPSIGPASGGTTPVTLSASAADAWTPTTVTWTFADGTTATGAQVTHDLATGSALAATVTATDAAGNATSRTVSRSASQVTAAAAAAKAQDAGATVTGLKASNKRFLATTGKPKGRRGTAISFTLASAARVTVTVSRNARGWKHGKACTTTRPAGRTSTRCTVTKKVETARVTGRAGKNTFAFNGSVKGHRLAAGTYALTFVATPTGGAAGKPSTIHVVIRRP